MREKPEDISDSGWLAFNRLADCNGYGEDKVDWGPWYFAFRVGYTAGMIEIIKKWEKSKKGEKND